METYLETKRPKEHKEKRTKLKLRNKICEMTCNYF